MLLESSCIIKKIILRNPNFNKRSICCKRDLTYVWNGIMGFPIKICFLARSTVDGWQNWECWVILKLHNDSTLLSLFVISRGSNSKQSWDGVLFTQSPFAIQTSPGSEGSPKKPAEEQHKTWLLFWCSLNALGSRRFILCTPRSITAQPNKDFCHGESFSSSELLSLLLIRLPTLLSVNELMRTLYFRLVETKRATAQLQSLRGRFSIFKARPRHLKGIKIKLVSLAWNKKLEAGPLHSQTLLFL